MEMLMKIEDFIFYLVISCIVIYAIVQILKGDENNSLKQSLKMKDDKDRRMVQDSEKNNGG